MSALVSIIMPVYNGERFIAEAIESVLAQSYTGWELIVVDDGSTDGTAEIVSGYDDPRVRYRYQENRGQTVALNRGLELAIGKYTTTLDADDWLAASSLQDRVCVLEAHPELGAVYCDGYYCDAQGTLLLRFSDRRTGNPVGDVYDAVITSPFFAAGSPVMIRRSILEQHQLRYDESIVWCQDWDFYIRVAEVALFGYADSPTVYYRLHGTNMTLSMPEGRRLESLIRTHCKVVDSSRFAAVSVPHKRAFFYRFLVRDLNNRVEDQENIVKSSTAFQSLPRRERAQLMRWVAMEYLRQGAQRDTARKLLRSACILAPLDARNVLAAILSTLSFDLTASLVRSRRIKRGEETCLLPFEVAEDVPNQ